MVQWVFTVQAWGTKFGPLAPPHRAWQGDYDTNAGVVMDGRGSLAASLVK